MHGKMARVRASCQVYREIGSNSCEDKAIILMGNSITSEDSSSSQARIVEYNCGLTIFYPILSYFNPVLLDELHHVCLTTPGFGLVGYIHNYMTAKITLP